MAVSLQISCSHCRRSVCVAAPSEEKRLIEVFVPIGADDGDKIIVDGEGAPSEFQGNYHTPSAFTCVTWRAIHSPAGRTVMVVRLIYVRNIA